MTTLTYVRSILWTTFVLVFLLIDTALIEEKILTNIFSEEVQV